MIEDLIKNIRNKIPPVQWKFNGFSIGDNFDLIENDSDSTMQKGSEMVSFRKAENSNLISSIFLPIPFFRNRQEEIVKEIRASFGAPYLEHHHMNDRLLYYPTHHLYLSIIQNDISKGITLSIGECASKLRKFTARDIIELFFKLSNNRKSTIYSEDRNSLSKIAQLKLQMLESLLTAFLGNPKINRFEGGKFIQESNDTYLDMLMKTIGSIEIFESHKRFSPTIIEKPSRYQVYEYWNMLFRYYIDSRLYIERSGRFNYTTWKQEELEAIKIAPEQEKTNIKLEALKNLLVKIIDPEGKEFDLKEMVSMFNYPEDDILWLEANDYY